MLCSFIFSPTLQTDVKPHVICALQLHIYVAAHLTELSLISLLIFSMGTQRVKVLMDSDSGSAETILNAFRKGGSKHEPEAPSGEGSSGCWRACCTFLCDIPLLRTRSFPGC